LATIRHVLAAENAKRKHFLRCELRAKFGIEIASGRCRERIAISALHLVADAHHVGSSGNHSQSKLAGPAARQYLDTSQCIVRCPKLTAFQRASQGTIIVK